MGPCRRAAAPAARAGPLRAACDRAPASGRGGSDAVCGSPRPMRAAIRTRAATDVACMFCMIRALGLARACRLREATSAKTAYYREL
jgi:hypothetical protein